MIPTITIIIQRPADGGRVVFETVTNEFGVPETESRLVFAGDVEQTDKYMAERNAKLDTVSASTAEPPRQIEGPVKIRIRRKPEPVTDPLDALDALETAEDAA